MPSNLKSSSLLFISFTINLTLSATAIANQLVVNGGSGTAVGTYNTGTNTPDTGYALYAFNGGAITSNSALTLITGGNLSHAAYAQGLNSSIFLAAGTRILTTGDGAKGAYAQDGATITVGPNSSIVTSAANADGLFAFSTSSPTTIKSTINATNISITTNGNTAHGVHANEGGIINLTGATIVTNGILSNGLYAIGAGNPTITTASQVTVSVNGDRASAASTVRGTMELNNANLFVTATALGGRGAVASSSGILTMNNGSITAT